MDTFNCKRTVLNEFFYRLEFKDFVDNSCIIQPGVYGKVPKLHVGVQYLEDGGSSTPMVLTKAQAKELVKHLNNFIRTGAV